MNHKLKNLIIVGSIALMLSACGISILMGGAVDGAATAVVAASNPVAPAGNPRQGPRGVMGEVLSVDESTLTVQDQRQERTVTVELTDSTGIFKQEEIEIGDVPVGASISARGSLDDDVFTATQVHIRLSNDTDPERGPGPGGDRPGEGNRPGGGRPQPDGTAQPDSTAQPPRSPGDRLFGTVEEVSDDTLIVKTADDSAVQLRLATDGKIVQRVEATIDDITVGTWIMAMGERSDTTVTATRIEIVPEMPQQP